MIAPRITAPDATLAALADALGRAAEIADALARVEERGGCVCNRESDGCAVKRPTRRELLRTFLSDKERAILRAVAGSAPCRANGVQSAVRAAVPRTDFYVLWSHLQVRGLVEHDEDGLFRLAAPWVADLAGVPEKAADGI